MGSLAGRTNFLEHTMSKRTRRAAKRRAVKPIDPMAVTVTIDQAQRMLNVGRSSIYEMEKAGQLEKRKYAGRHLVTMASIKRLGV
jgi:hypothetical protein